MKIYNDLIQGTDEWLNIRCGKITGSQFHLFFGNSSTKENLIEKLASERYCNKISSTKTFSNEHIERGNELEDEARQAYESYIFSKVKEVGFVELNKNIGCSPDGLVGNNGIIEIKCKDNHTFFKQIRKGVESLEPLYKTQIQFNLWVTDREWCDYVCYNEDFIKPYVKRIKRDDERFLGKKGFYSIKEIIEKSEEINNEIEKRMKDFKERF